MKTLLTLLIFVFANSVLAVATGPVLPPGMTFPPSNKTTQSTNKRPFNAGDSLQKVSDKMDQEATALAAVKKFNSQRFTAATEAQTVGDKVVLLTDETTQCQLLVSLDVQQDLSVLVQPQGQLDCAD